MIEDRDILELLFSALKKDVGTVEQLVEVLTIAKAISESHIAYNKDLEDLRIAIGRM